mgnify:CR=1 FL=1
MTEKHTGSCLCGGVAFEVTGPMRPVIACHCTQCRKSTGHYFASTAAPAAMVRFLSEETLSWYRSSPEAERGFCARCGSSLFWRRVGSDTLSILAGAIDGATGLAIDRHIFAAWKGDYYEIPPGVPVFAEGG